MVNFVSWIFEDVMQYILFTPFDFFISNTATSILMKMGIFSAGLVTVLAMAEGFKRMLSIGYTPMAQVFMRYPLALIVSALAPTMFYYAGVITNTLVKVMGSITGSSLDGVDYFSSLLHETAYHTYEAALTFVLLIILIFYFFKVMLYHAVRWFGLIFNMVTTPIAMTAYMFSSYENVASSWLQDSVSKFLVVVVHSFFLGLIAVILYAPNVVNGNTAGDTFWETFIRIMISIGGLHMMMKPPAWITKWFDKGKDIKQSTGVTRKVIRLLLATKGIK